VWNPKITSWQRSRQSSFLGASLGDFGSALFDSDRLKSSPSTGRLVARIVVSSHSRASWSMPIRYVKNSLLIFIVASFANLSIMCPLPAREFRRGDANSDGRNDISDAVRTLLWLFADVPPLDCADAADTDDNGRVELTDAVALLDFFFRASAPPPAPGTSCGEDPTEDPLDCAGYPGCVDEWVPLFTDATPLEPGVLVDTEDALITRVADRARDRHAREDQFSAYDHYLSFYWEHRTVGIEIVDPIGRGGDTITFNVTSLWKLKERQAELRFFYRGINTVAEYYNNGVMTKVDDLHYTRSVRTNAKTRRPLAVGDRIEFELSQFLDAPPNGRENYYGTAFLYVVGRGLVPWEARGVFGDDSTEREDSYPIPEAAWLGGRTTVHRQYSDEPEHLFLQMATNLSDRNGQPFVRGRRVHHSDFGDGDHNESRSNPDFDEIAGTLGPRYINRSCIACHVNNGRALAPEPGDDLDRFVIRVGLDDGSPYPDFGSVLQGRSTSDDAEPRARLDAWIEEDGLRRPRYRFSGTTPEHFSARITPQLVGMGLLEAIPESALAALADPEDADGDGISGRLRLVRDPETHDLRVGRFGWKAGQATVRHQVAAALNTDIGVRTSVYPRPDCGSTQDDCGPSGSELADEHLDDLAKYIALLGVHARRELDDPDATRGEQLFEEIGCADCHRRTFRTSEHHPFAELRDQTIHPYTDLLLHDMGPGLADTLPEGDSTLAPASGSEWRTPPLWGIGLTVQVSGGESYLHDGRARTLREAILWHGGEGERSRNAFVELSAQDRDALIAFLESL